MAESAERKKWQVEFQLKAANQLRKLGRPIQQRILRFFRERLLAAGDPRQIGKALQGNKGNLWRYRIGDYRAICKIEVDKLIVLVLELGHRREIYR